MSFIAFFYIYSAQSLKNAYRKVQLQMRFELFLYGYIDDLHFVEGNLSYFEQRTKVKEMLQLKYIDKNCSSFIWVHW